MSREPIFKPPLPIQPVPPEFPPMTKAADLTGLWAAFDPTLAVDPRTEFYIPRTDPELNRLVFHLLQASGPFHGFLCGHQGSGKTTELNRLQLDARILERYLPIYLTSQQFGAETVHLSHDALLVEIGLALVKEGKRYEMEPGLGAELEAWGQQIVRTFLHDEAAVAEAGAKAGAWLAFFKAQLQTRREWKTERKQILEPRVQDLIGLLNRMAQDLQNKSDKRILVIVDDLEKGALNDSREMHSRLFQEHYDALVQPRFSILYTLPVYFRALEDRRIPIEQLYAFSAVRLYEHDQKGKDRPELAADQPDYALMRQFIEKRVADMGIFEGEALDELLRIGGGLFRETARAIYNAAFFAETRGAKTIGLEDAKQVFNQVKKSYQPTIRGEAIKVLKAALASETGWVPGVEPHLQSKAVVEYENGDLWLDLRYPLKAYVRGLPDV